jgi:predicted Zn-dependent protease with MMP-like domain
MRNASSALSRSRRLRFEKRVERVVSRLDPDVRRALDNVAIVINDEPTAPGEEQFGLYEGIPLSERNQSYSMVLPDRIVLYQEALMESFPEPAELDEQIRITVLHEIGHHLGIDEDGLERIGLS